MAGVVAAMKPAVPKGTVIADCLTSDPTVGHARAAKLAAVGVDFVDAPLTRAPTGPGGNGPGDHVPHLSDVVARSNRIKGYNSPRPARFRISAPVPNSHAGAWVDSRTVLTSAPSSGAEIVTTSPK